jgi:hypothetical protein
MKVEKDITFNLLGLTGLKIEKDKKPTVSLSML